MKSRRLIRKQSETTAKRWYVKLVFNLLIAAILAVILYTVVSDVGSVAVPAFVTGTQVEVAATEGGTLEQLKVDRNERVQRGQVLAELRNQTLDARISAASAELEQAISSRQQARSDVNQGLKRFSINEKIADIRGRIAMLDVEIQSASREIRDAHGTYRLRQDALQRAEELHQEGALTVSEVETRRLALLEARTTTEDLRAKLLRLQTQREGLDENTELYKEQLQNLQKEAGDFLTELDVSTRKLRGQIETLLAQRKQLTLRANADGTILELYRREGELVSEGETVLTISTGDRLWIEAHVPAERSQTIAPGDPVEIEVETLGQQRLPGSVKGVLPVLRTQGTNDVGFLASSEPYAVVLIEFQDPEDAKGRLQVGQRVSVVFHTSGT